MKPARILYVAILTFLPMLRQTTLPVNAQPAAGYQDALKAITDTAAQICQTVPTQAENQQLKLSGQGNAQLNGLLQKVLNLGISGAAEYQSGSSNGVLQSQLAGAMADGNTCRLKVLGILVDTILKPAPPAPASASAPTINQSTRGANSPAIAGVNGNVTINAAPETPR